jgi:hypothetical protein
MHIAATGDPELVRHLVTVAERACIVTNTLRDAVPIAFVFQESAAAAS